MPQDIQPLNGATPGNHSNKTKKRNKQKSQQATASQSHPFGSPGTPRMNHYQRLMSRFYEPLVLLHTLSSFPRNQPSIIHENEASRGSEKSLHKQFLNDLAYLCDYLKGGDTVVSIAIEERPQGYVFWVASDTKHTTKITTFLKKVLDILKSITLSHAKREDFKRDLTLDCIKFSKSRIEEYSTCIQPLLDRCSATLGIDHEDRELLRSLGQLRTHRGDLSVLCFLCYGILQSPHMKTINRRAIGKESNNGPDSRSTVFQNMKYYIERLGHYFRAVDNLAQAANRFNRYLDEFEIQALPTPAQSGHPPRTDKKTTLDQIVIRMFPSDAADMVRRCQGILRDMNRKVNLESQLLDTYKDDTGQFRPRVHAEIVLLEHFFSENLKFPNSIKYIGCSKPPCYCCALYIRHHPGNFEEPTSHKKLCLAWRPPDVEPDRENPAFIHQRDILNSMIKDIRRHAIDKISLRAGLNGSQYGISKSVSTNARQRGLASSESRSTDLGDIESSTFETTTSEVPVKASTSLHETNNSCHNQLNASEMKSTVPPTQDLDLDSEAEGGVSLSAK